MIIKTVGEDLTTAVTRTEDVSMAADGMCRAGVCIGLMAIGNVCTFRRR
jgi:hypothetical protein